jgi:hypothetical protein
MRSALFLLVAMSIGCASAPKPAAEAPAPVPSAELSPRILTETLTVRDPALEREVARLKIQTLESAAQMADLERRLGEATTELVRAMARLRTLATRAEAASAIAEAEVTLQQLRGRAGQQSAPEVAQAERSLRSASEAFAADNYGGAVYLATQAKRAATAGRGRLAETEGTRPGERAFSVPVPLVTTSRANLRSGPGSSFAVVTSVNGGTALTGYAHEQEWLRVSMADGRGAWIHQSLVRGATAGRP